MPMEKGQKHTIETKEKIQFYQNMNTKFYNKTKGQGMIGIIIGIAGGIFGLVASVVAPVVYIGNIKENVSILDIRLTATEKNIDDIKSNVEYIRRAIEQSNKGLVIKIPSELATSTRQ